MSRVIIISPFFSEKSNIIKRNIKYAIKCLKHSLYFGESPLAFHLLYTYVLDDNKKEEREKGFKASKIWYKQAEKIAIYIDYGVSSGMQKDINIAREYLLPFELRCFGSITDCIGECEKCKAFIKE